VGEISVSQIVVGYVLTAAPVAPPEFHPWFLHPRHFVGLFSQGIFDCSERDRTPGLLLWEEVL